MDTNEVIALIENCMDFEESTLRLDDVRSEFEEWDSLTALSIIASVDEKFHKHLTGEELKKVKTVSDLVKLISK